MTPEMRARITAKNETAPAFGEVARDAKLAADSVAASGKTAAAGLRVEEAALQAVGRASRLAASQQRNLVFQLNDVGVSLAGGQNPLLVLIQQGSQIATIWGPHEGGVGRAFKETGNILVSLVTKFWPLTAAVAALSVGIGAMTTEINKNQKVQVGWTHVVVASWQLATESILTKFQPVLDFFGNLWSAVSPGIAEWLSGTVGAVDLAIRDIGTLWGSLPGVVGEAAINSANALLGVLDDMLNTHKDRFTAYLLQMGNAAGPILGAPLSGAGMLLANVPRMSFKPLDNPFAGTSGNMDAALRKNAADVAGTSYLGLIGDRARKNVVSATTDKDGGVGKATDKVRELADRGIGYLTEKTNAFADAARSAFSNVGSSLLEAFRKGGDVAANALDVILDKVSQLSGSMVDTGINKLLDMGLSALFSGGKGSAFRGGWGSKGLLSFEGGGFTGSGARSGGIDNRGGFLSILHPDETVEDHKRASGGGAQMRGPLINIFNSSKASVSAVPNGDSIDVYVDEIVAKKMGARGSQTSKAMRVGYGARSQLVRR